MPDYRVGEKTLQTLLKIHASSVDRGDIVGDLARDLRDARVEKSVLVTQLELMTFHRNSLLEQLSGLSRCAE